MSPNEIKVGQTVYQYGPQEDKGLGVVMELDMPNFTAKLGNQKGETWDAGIEYLIDVTGCVEFKSLSAGDMFKDILDAVWVHYLNPDDDRNAICVKHGRESRVGDRASFVSGAPVFALVVGDNHILDTPHGEEFAGQVAAEVQAGLPRLVKGQKVHWEDPDRGISSGEYIVDEVMIDLDDEDSELTEDTIVRIHNEAGSEAEVYLRELAPIGKPFTVVGMWCQNWQGHCDIVVADNAAQAAEIYHEYDRDNDLQAMGVIEGEHPTDWLINQ